MNIINQLSEAHTNAEFLFYLTSKETDICPICNNQTMLNKVFCGPFCAMAHFKDKPFKGLARMGHYKQWESKL